MFCHSWFNHIINLKMAEHDLHRQLFLFFFFFKFLIAVLKICSNVDETSECFLEYNFGIMFNGVYKCILNTGHVLKILKQILMLSVRWMLMSCLTVLRTGKQWDMWQTDTVMCIVHDQCNFHRRHRVWRHQYLLVVWLYSKLSFICRSFLFATTVAVLPEQRMAAPGGCAV
jgi:hypothetical protein